MIEEINIDGFAAKARSLGLSVFYGFMDEQLAPMAYWDNEHGDYAEFIRLAKDLGVPMVVINGFVLDDDDIDESKSDIESLSGEAPEGVARDLKKRLESFRKYAGKVGSVAVSWTKDGVVYNYIESTKWAADYFYLLDEIDNLLEGS
ncbi:MAG: hypothetical protein RXP97_01665 [Nitrososphaeria archaeon]|jgi:sugar phosphate isomerase/epimerase